LESGGLKFLQQIDNRAVVVVWKNQRLGVAVAAVAAVAAEGIVLGKEKKKSDKKTSGSGKGGSGSGSLESGGLKFWQQIDNRAMHMCRKNQRLGVAVAAVAAVGAEDMKKKWLKKRKWLKKQVVVAKVAVAVAVLRVAVWNFGGG
jgi:hypothetical protein